MAGKRGRWSLQAQQRELSEMQWARDLWLQGPGVERGIVRRGWERWGVTGVGALSQLAGGCRVLMMWLRRDDLFRPCTVRSERGWIWYSGTVLDSEAKYNCIDDD